MSWSRARDVPRYSSGEECSMRPAGPEPLIAFIKNVSARSGTCARCRYEPPFAVAPSGRTAREHTSAPRHSAPRGRRPQYPTPHQNKRAPHTAVNHISRRLTHKRPRRHRTPCRADEMVYAAHAGAARAMGATPSVLDIQHPMCTP